MRLHERIKKVDVRCPSCGHKRVFVPKGLVGQYIEKCSRCGLIRR